MIILSGYQNAGSLIKANKLRGGKFFKKNAILSEVFAKRMQNETYRYYFVGRMIDNQYAKYVVYVCDDSGRITDVGRKSKWNTFEEAVNMAHNIAKAP